MAAVVGGAVAWAWAAPHAFLAATGSFYAPSWAGHGALVATMLAVGMSGMTLRELQRALRAPGRLLDGLAIQLAVMPALALAICHAAALPLPSAIG